MPLADPEFEYLFATIGAAIGSLVLLPQIIKTWRTKSTEGLSPFMMIIWGFGTLPWAAYTIAERLSLPLQAGRFPVTTQRSSPPQIQPQIFMTLAYISTAQTMHYRYKVSFARSAIYFSLILATSAIVETMSIYTIWYGFDHGTDMPLLVAGYCTDAFAILGLLPQFVEVFRLGEVKGISTTMLMLDIVGGTFSAMSLFYRSVLDVPGVVFFITIASLDMLLIVLALVLNPLKRRRLRRARRAQLAHDAKCAEAGEIEEWKRGGMFGWRDEKKDWEDEKAEAQRRAEAKGKGRAVEPEVDEAVNAALRAEGPKKASEVDDFAIIAWTGSSDVRRSSESIETINLNSPDEGEGESTAWSKA